MVGLAPEANPGRRFENDIRWWHGVWTFVCRSCPDAVGEEDVIGCRYPSGYEVPAGRAAEWGERLGELLAAGAVQGYLDRWESCGNPGLPPAFSVENVARFAEFCRASGGFRVTGDFPGPRVRHSM
jgi:hypothetical protein